MPYKEAPRVPAPKARSKSTPGGSRRHNPMEPSPAARAPSGFFARLATDWAELAARACTPHVDTGSRALWPQLDAYFRRRARMASVSGTLEGCQLADILIAPGTPRPFSGAPDYSNSLFSACAASLRTLTSDVTDFSGPSPSPAWRPSCLRHLRSSASTRLPFGGTATRAPSVPRRCAGDASAALSCELRAPGSTPLQAAGLMGQPSQMVICDPPPPVWQVLTGRLPAGHARPAAPRPPRSTASPSAASSTKAAHGGRDRASERAVRGAVRACGSDAACCRA